MRTTAKLSFLLLPFAGLLAGCEVPDLCTEYAGICGAGGGGGGSTTTTAQGGAGGTGGSGGSVDPGCHPSALGDGVALPDTCDGVFVESGATGGDGSRTSPYGTLTDALADASATKPIYVCGGAAGLTENPTVTVSTSLYGGLDCATWARTSTKTPLDGAPDLPALTIQGDVTVTVEDFIITAADGAADGANSTGLFVNGATVTLDSVEIAAGNGKAGTAGTTPTTAVTGGTPGVMGNAGCVGTAQVTGAAGDTTTCPNGDTSTGGNGGNGTVVNSASSNGLLGESIPAAPTAGDNHGKGETVDSMTMLLVPCTDGTQGAPGGNGTVGAGANSMAWGALSALGYVGAAGQPGMAGHPGQGGGGGGGARGASHCGNATHAGHSGGSGGSGGCGGNPATGGSAGGSSIGIAARNGTLTFGELSVTLGSGAIGGAGASGQAGGGAGGPGLAGGAGACAGGSGGQGGQGGAGGGGRGGHALALVISGMTAPTTAGLSVTGGSFGGGGATAAGANNAGADGAVCTVLDLDAGTCTP